MDVRSKAKWAVASKSCSMICTFDDVGISDT